MGDEQDLPPREGEFSDDKSEGERKRLFERVVPEVLKGMVERAVERGVGRIAEGPENLRHLVGDLKLPKEVLHYLYTQIDETKNGLYRAVAKEIRDVLEHTQFAEEMTKVLTKLSFEIKTEIRFIPNDASKDKPAPEGEGRDDEPDDEDADEPKGKAGMPKPEVSAQVSVKDRSKEARRERRRREGP
jgi:hypothetical protein